MKKSGFTLAEILITLTIIGVVAAVTLPTLMSDTATAQVGPKLAKAAAMFEQANKNLLTENSADTLTDADLVASSADYSDALSNHLNMVRFSYPTGTTGITLGNAYISKDGIIYSTTIDGTWTGAIDTTLGVHKQKIGLLDVDINGSSKPNKQATDQFRFVIYNDGSLRPVGGSDYLEGDASAVHWNTENGCQNDKVPATPLTCTGAIFENNLKVLYK